MKRRRRNNESGERDTTLQWKEKQGEKREEREEEYIRIELGEEKRQLDDRYQQMREMRSEREQNITEKSRGVETGQCSIKRIQVVIKDKFSFKEQ